MDEGTSNPGYFSLKHNSNPDGGKTNIATNPINDTLHILLVDAANKGGAQTVYFDAFLGIDNITYENLLFLYEHPDIVLVLDYTFWDVETEQNIHCHVVIQSTIIPYIIDVNVPLYGPANVSGFCQYYNLLPEDVKKRNPR